MCRIFEHLDVYVLTADARDATFISDFPVGGLTLLALLSMIMDVFRIGYYVGYQSCVSAVLGVYPVIHASHTIAQVSWKDTF